MDPVLYNSIRDLSRKVIGKGYGAVQFRTYWFQRISCALQRMHATSFKRNLATMILSQDRLVYTKVWVMLMHERFKASVVVLVVAVISK